MQVNAFIHERPPQAFDHSIVDPSAPPIHPLPTGDCKAIYRVGDAHAGFGQRVGPFEAGKLAALDALLRVKRRFVSDLFLYAAA